MDQFAGDFERVVPTHRLRDSAHNGGLREPTLRRWTLDSSVQFVQIAFRIGFVFFNELVDLALLTSLFEVCHSIFSTSGAVPGKKPQLIEVNGFSTVVSFS